MEQTEVSAVVYTETELIDAYWRTGRKVGRTVYAMVHAEPSDDDILIGMMDSPRVAHLLVQEHNAARPDATCGWRGFAGGSGCVRRAAHPGRHGFVDGSGEQDA